jgi:hypothetical protein
MDSVPYFCSPTETVADIANSKPTNVHQLPHLLKKLANTLPPDRADTTPLTLNPHVHDSSPIDTNPPLLRPYQKPTRFYDIFIDNYIHHGSTGYTDNPLATPTMPVALHR